MGSYVDSYVKRHVLVCVYVCVRELAPSSPAASDTTCVHSMGGQVSTADVHVVVVGGGFGGISAALQLQSRGLSFTLVDMRDSFHHNVAGLRASLLPGNNI